MEALAPHGARHGAARGGAWRGACSDSPLASRVPLARADDLTIEQATQTLLDDLLARKRISSRDISRDKLAKVRSACTAVPRSGRACASVALALRALLCLTRASVPSAPALAAAAGLGVHPLPAHQLFVPAQLLPGLRLHAVGRAGAHVQPLLDGVSSRDQWGASSSGLAPFGGLHGLHR